MDCCWCLLFLKLVLWMCRYNVVNLDCCNCVCVVFFLLKWVGCFGCCGWCVVILFVVVEKI